MKGLAGKPELMEKNFRITICSRTCCQCWGQKHFNLTASGHPLEHRLSHFAGSSGNFSCQFPVPRGEALARLPCSVASSYGGSWKVPYGQRRFCADTRASWGYRAQVCFAQALVAEPQPSPTLQCPRGENLQLFSMAEWWDSTDNCWYICSLTVTFTQGYAF